MRQVESREWTAWEMLTSGKAAEMSHYDLDGDRSRNCQIERLRRKSLRVAPEEQHPYLDRRKALRLHAWKLSRADGE